MILIADSGSTTSNWGLICQSDVFFELEGYNPYFVDSDYIIASLHNNLPAMVNREEIEEVHFYGAGCFTERAAIIEKAMSAVFPRARIYVELDLLAAARALLGETKGFAAILGTGTNTCLYNGKKITQNIDSLGFILGDEGSGGSMGKKLAGDFIRNKMPADLREAFMEKYAITPDEIITRIYTQPMPNRFCAGFAPFLHEHIKSAYCRQLVKDGFQELFANLVSAYPAYRRNTFNCVGSVGYYFQDIITEVSERFGMRTGKFLRGPIHDLVDYHRKKIDQLSLHKTIK